MFCNAIRTGNATTAYVSRKITESEKPPTLILDEIDTVFNSFGKGDDVLRSILNAGYKKGAKVGRCKMMGNIYETELDSFCPVALAGLGKLLKQSPLEPSIFQCVPACQRSGSSNFTSLNAGEAGN